MFLGRIPLFGSPFGGGDRCDTSNDFHRIIDDNASDNGDDDNEHKVTTTVLDMLLVTLSLSIYIYIHIYTVYVYT